MPQSGRGESAGELLLASPDLKTGQCINKILPTPHFQGEKAFDRFASRVLYSSLF